MDTDGASGDGGDIRRRISGRDLKGNLVCWFNYDPGAACDELKQNGFVQMRGAFKPAGIGGDPLGENFYRIAELT